MLTLKQQEQRRIQLERESKVGLFHTMAQIDIVGGADRYKITPERKQEVLEAIKKRHLTYNETGVIYLLSEDFEIGLIEECIKVAYLEPELIEYLHNYYMNNERPLETSYMVRFDGELYKFDDGLKVAIFDGLLGNGIRDMEKILEMVDYIFDLYLSDDNPTPVMNLVDYVAEKYDEIQDKDDGDVLEDFHIEVSIY